MFNVQCSMFNVQCLKTNDKLKTHVVYTYPLWWFFSLQHIRDCVKMYSHKRNIVPIPSVKTHCHKRHKEHKRDIVPIPNEKNVKPQKTQKTKKNIARIQERNEPQKIILMSCPHALSGHLSPHDTGIIKIN